MRYWIIVALVLSLAGVLVFSTSACGGGGTAVVVVDPVTLFSGSYCSFTFFGDVDPVPDEAAAGWGTWAGDGAGMTAAGGAENFNRNGVLIGPIPNGGVAYTVDADHKMTILFAGSALYQGGISSDGSLACWASVATNSNPQITIMGRKQGAHTDASLNGLYHLVAFFYDYGGVRNGAWWGTATFNGAGVGSSTATINLDGTVGIPVMSPAAYGVAADGTVTGTFLGGVDVRGAILANGELVVLSGGTTAGQIPMLVVLVKASAGASQATLAGSYSLVIIGGETSPPPVWSSALLDAESNGAGGIVFPSAVVNDDGMITSGAGGAAPYNIAPDGAFSSGDAVGGVSASGNVAVITNGTMTGDDPALWFMLRR